MFGGRKEKRPTRVIVVRHLLTDVVVRREELRKNDFYIRLGKILQQNHMSALDIQHARQLGSSLLASFPLEEGKDADTPLLPEQRAKGQEIGKQIVARFGMPGNWEISPYRRTRETSEFLREGIREQVPDALLPISVINSFLHERSFGLSDEYLSSKIFLANYLAELLKYIRKRDKYTYPQGESSKAFKRRIKRQVRKLQKAKKYEGKVNVFVTHSLVIEEFGKELTGKKVDHHNITPGSVLVFEAGPKRFLRRRQFSLVRQVA